LRSVVLNVEWHVKQGLNFYNRLPRKTQKTREFCIGFTFHPFRDVGHRENRSMLNLILQSKIPGERSWIGMPMNHLQEFPAMSVHPQNARSLP
jgi:hypothetical protein